MLSSPMVSFSPFTIQFPRLLYSKIHFNYNYKLTTWLGHNLYWNIPDSWAIGAREIQGAPCTLQTEGPSNCFNSIWTPKTWPFYSLCFPCFSPFLISFCSASISLHPSELREGWCVFTFRTQHKTEISSFICHKNYIFFLLFFFKTSIDIIFISVAHSMFMFPLRMPPVLVRMLDCPTGGACLHLWGGVVGTIFASVWGSICMFTS